MNIKITEQEHKKLLKYETMSFLVGSHLYGTNTEDSDKDYLRFYRPPLDWKDYGLPNIHQFQYSEQGIDHNWTTLKQFAENQKSGDSTINSDLIMFDSDFVENYTNEKRLSMVRTYKVIKAYIGFAKRDIKKGRLFHAHRSLYCAECLMDGGMPKKEVIQRLHKNQDQFDSDALTLMEKEFRQRANQMYDKGELSLYHIPTVKDPLLQKLLESNNVKEFKY